MSGDFLKTLQDDDINVRRVALVMFNSAAHNKPSLIRGLLSKVLPHLYKETQIRKDLIREVGLYLLMWCQGSVHVRDSVCVLQVEMGPFKHTVDDGLDVRKAAFECMYTLLDSCLEGLDVLQFLDHVEEGLKDHYDIRVGPLTVHCKKGPGKQHWSINVSALFSHMCLFVCKDADLPDAGQAGFSVSCCGSPETGQTGGAS